MGLAEREDRIVTSLSKPGFFKLPQFLRPGHVGDREFLPAAIEILETPPSPIRMGLILSICGFLGGAVVWSYVSPIDIIATAQGKIQPVGRVKVVQPLETGKIRSIEVRNGQHVMAGDVLVLLDSTEATADQAAIVAVLASFAAEVSRRNAALHAAMQPGLQTVKIDFDTKIPTDIKEREQRVLDADIAQLAASVASLRAQLEIKRAERDGFAKTITAQKQLLDTQQERVTMRSALLERAAGSKSNLIDAIETMQYQLTSLSQQESQFAQAGANMEMLNKEITKTIETFVSDNSQKLADAERQMSDAEQRLAKASAKLDHMRLVAPIDGTIQNSTLTNVDQVVTVGAEIMRIVPDTDTLEIEAYLPNRDVSFVKEGQQAIIKIDAFPFTSYGTIEATVLRVGRDAVPEPDATQAEEYPSRQGKPMAGDGTQRVQNLVFPITLQPTRSSITIDGMDQKLTAGMSVTAEVHTGSRRILEFIFSPLLRISSTAMRER